MAAKLPGQKSPVGHFLSLSKGSSLAPHRDGRVVNRPTSGSGDSSSCLQLSLLAIAIGVSGNWHPDRGRGHLSGCANPPGGRNAVSR